MQAAKAPPSGAAQKVAPTTRRSAAAASASAATNKPVVPSRTTAAAKATPASTRAPVPRPAATKRGTKPAVKSKAGAAPVAPVAAAPAVTQSAAIDATTPPPAEQPSAPEPPIVAEPVVLAMPKPEPVLGLAVVKFNHYKESFRVVDGVIKKDDIDEEYSISFAYKGNFELHLRDAASGERLESRGNEWVGASDGRVYQLEIDEDSHEVAKREAQPQKVYQAAATDAGAKKGVDLITQELKQMSTDELKEQSDKYKALLEARDLQDILY